VKFKEKESRLDFFMPLYCRDFLAATLGWTAEERGHYITLLMVQWDRGSLPECLEKLERLSPGLSSCWEVIQEKFPTTGDGFRKNARLETHREKCLEVRKSRSEAGRMGGIAKANAKQTSSKTLAKPKQTSSKPLANAKQTSGKTLANPLAKRKQKPSIHSHSHSHSHSQNQSQKKHTHTPEKNESLLFPERGAGWAADQWAEFAKKWNQTTRANPWTAFTAPAGWVECVSQPGWAERAEQALGRLPQCEFFDHPLAVTKFFEFVDRILAGEFDHAKQTNQRKRQPAVGRL